MLLSTVRAIVGATFHLLEVCVIRLSTGIEHDLENHCGLRQQGVAFEIIAVISCGDYWH
jgi:hypothetical protein